MYKCRMCGGDLNTGMVCVQCGFDNGNSFTYSTNDTKKPHICPVCQGVGRVPAGFYESVGSNTWVNSGGDEECRSCNGTGIVWEP